MRKFARLLIPAVTLCAVGLTSSLALAQREQQEQPAAAGAGEALGTFDRSVLEWAEELAGKLGATLEKWTNGGEVTEAQLFSYLYFPIPKTSPPKFTTDYDKLSDRDVSPILEAYLAKAPEIAYVVMSDRNGYIPTHNRKFSQPLTGNLESDLVNNRTKRIFCDRTGLAAARNAKPYLLQSYKRDTGELMYDLTVPVKVKGKHWGAVRFGYRSPTR